MYTFMVEGSWTARKGWRLESVGWSFWHEVDWQGEAGSGGVGLSGAVEVVGGAVLARCDVEGAAKDEAEVLLVAVAGLAGDES